MRSSKIKARGNYQRVGAPTEASRPPGGAGGGRSAADLLNNLQVTSDQHTRPVFNLQHA